MSVLFQGREVVLCVGPGGVGKTTTAASIALHAVPALLTKVNPDRLIAEILSTMDTGERHDLLDRTLYTMACHRSIRGGDFLKEEEMRALLREADEVPESQACPHGRPTRVLLTVDELEKLFGRRGF